MLAAHSDVEGLAERVTRLHLMAWADRRERSSGTDELLTMMVYALRSSLRCPHCDFAQVLDMPADACMYFYACVECGTVIRPAAGDCCVFCSYGSVPCPPRQVADGGGDCCPPPPA
jgi:hypothetical protein